MKNSKQDFIETIKSDVPEIICPSCGSPMTLKNKATFDVILSVNSRKVMNDIIRSYRSFIIRNESELKSLNLFGVTKKIISGAYPFAKSEYVDEYGLFDTEGSNIIKKFLSVPDILSISETISQLITIEDLDITLSSEKPDNAKVILLIESLIFGFEPHPFIGPMLNLLFDQDEVKDWVNLVKIGSKLVDNAEHRKEVEKLVMEVSPYYYQYLSKIKNAIDIHINKSDNTKFLSRYSKEEASVIKDQIIRCYYVIAILVGHKQNAASSATIPNVIPFAEKGIPFDFPRLVIVSQPILSQLLRSKSIIENSGFSISAEFNILSRKREENTSEENTTEPKKNQSTETLEKELNDILKSNSFLTKDLQNYVEFACNGLPASIPKFKDEVEKNNDEESTIPDSDLTNNIGSLTNRTCGWYPKDEPTHPIVLIGSTGTSKSSVMMAGLTTFINSAGSLGLSPRSTTSDDVTLINWYSEQFFNGEMPKATETSSRFSVELTLVKSQSINERVNFIFTDIPGEMVARSLERKDTDPVMINLLKYAETIVFFFDIATEPYFYSIIKNGKKRDEWTELIKHVEYLKSEKRGRTNQILLLNKLIEDLRKLRGDKNIKEEVRFVCLIPKADFFVREDGNTGFLNGFYKELRGKNIIDSSQLNREDVDGVLSFRSMGGVRFKSDEKDLIKKQKEIITLIDQEARKALITIGNSLGDDTASLSDKNVLKDKIEVELLQVITNTFSEAYLIPVSAQGMPKIPTTAQGSPKVPVYTQDSPEMLASAQSNSEISETKEKGQVILNGSPNQKLSEYVFITPIVLELLRDRDKSKKK